MPRNGPGEIVWHDLTVKDAESLRDFYKAVVGWDSSDHDMGEYDDYVMQTPGAENSVGICHARGANANIPPQWLIYVRVASVADSIEECWSLGGELVDGPRKMGDSQFCVIRDPAGAYLALIEG